MKIYYCDYNPAVRYERRGWFRWYFVHTGTRYVSELGPFMTYRRCKNAARFVESMS